MTSQTSELMVKAPSEFALFGMENGATEIQELIQENLGEETFRPSDLDRIKVPSGGGKVFAVPTINGEEDIKELECIVLMVKPFRLYYVKSYEETGEGTPPDCMSADGVNGFGDPGGFCPSCPLAQYDEEKGGSDCNEKRNMFILPANAILPYVLSVPQMSIKPMKKYLQNLMRAGKSLNKVTTKVSLQKDKSSKGLDYSRLVFNMGAELTREQVEMVKGYKESFAKVIESTHTQTAATGNGGMPSFDDDQPY